MKYLIVLITFSVLSICASPISNKDDNSENQLINIINDIDNEKSLYLFGGLSIEQISNKNQRSFQTSSSLDDSFLNRIQNYLNTHELKFNLPNDSEENEIENGRNQSSEESRTRKLKKILLPLLLAIKLKLALVLPLLMLAIKAISLKGLIAGSLALLFSGASFFRDMLSSKKDHITTAYITGHPLNAEIVHSTDWHRSGQASAQELAYSGYNYHTLPASSY